MATPLSRCTAAEPGRPADVDAVLGERSGDDWISRTITTNGIISVPWQEIDLIAAHPMVGGTLSGVATVRPWVVR